MACIFLILVIAFVASVMIGILLTLMSVAEDLVNPGSKEQESYGKAIRLWFGMAFGTVVAMFVLLIYCRIIS